MKSLSFILVFSFCFFFVLHLYFPCAAFSLCPLPPLCSCALPITLSHTHAQKTTNKSSHTTTQKATKVQRKFLLSVMRHVRLSAPTLSSLSSMRRQRISRVACCTCPWRAPVRCTTAAASASPQATTSTSGTAADAPARKFTYAPRLRYTAPWRSKTVTDFLVCQESCVVSIAHTYRHPLRDITITLIPLRHFAHPEFFRQVDDLCCQHESVLMEGRTPLTGSPYSTIVPPRTRVPHVRPPEHEDDEGWEPREVEKFFQPFSWGVAESPSHTVVHAADRYDYERLPWWCSVRFNAPVLGSLQREQHCLNMVYPLCENMYKSFAIPWGAAHMPVFHEMLLDNGFENVGMCSLVVLNRVDGIISEGEFSKMQRWQRKRARRVNYIYVAGLIAFFAFANSYVSVDYRHGPARD